MRTTMISWFLYGASIVAVVAAFIQWSVKFPDISQLAFGLNIALSIVICGFMHSAFRNYGNDQHTSNKIRDEEIAGLSRALDREVNYARELESKLDKYLKEK